MTVKVYLVRGIAAVDSINSFETRFSLKYDGLARFGLVFIPKNFESEKRFMPALTQQPLWINRQISTILSHLPWPFPPPSIVSLSLSLNQSDSLIHTFYVIFNNLFAALKRIMEQTPLFSPRTAHPVKFTGEPLFKRYAWPHLTDSSQSCALKWEMAPNPRG